MTAPIIVVMLLLTVLLLTSAYMDRQKSLVSLNETNERLRTYRKIRHALGIHMLTFYPSLIPSDSRMQLIKQLGIYDTLGDDEAEKRWERLWLPKLLDVSKGLEESNLARQDAEFAETIDGFRTNERLIEDAKSQRNRLISRPTVSLWPNDAGIQDSHVSSTELTDRNSTK